MPILPVEGDYEIYEFTIAGSSYAPVRIGTPLAIKHDDHRRYAAQVRMHRHDARVGVRDVVAAHEISIVASTPDARTRDAP